MSNQENRVESVQVVCAIAVGLFMVGKSIYEIYRAIARLALYLGRRTGTWYYGSKYCSPAILEGSSAVNTEAVEIKEAAGRYLCGWCLFASTAQAGYLHLRNFDYAASVELEGKIRKYAVDIWEWYVSQWEAVIQ